MKSKKQFDELFARIKSEIGIGYADFDGDTYESDSSRLWYGNGYVFFVHPFGENCIELGCEYGGILFNYRINMNTLEDDLGNKVEEDFIDNLYDEIPDYYFEEEEN